MNLTATETEDLLWRVKLLEQKVAELERNAVMKHWNQGGLPYNPWPVSDIPPYQPHWPIGNPVITLTDEQKEQIKKLFETTYKENNIV